MAVSSSNNLPAQVFTGYFLMNLQGDFYQNQAGFGDGEVMWLALFLFLNQ